MAEESVERVFGPIYPRAFTCDGAVCGSLCCGRWHIPVDALTRKRWASLPESARDEIFGNLSETERGWGMRHGENGNCAFLDGDGLCRLAIPIRALPTVLTVLSRVPWRFHVPWRRVSSCFHPRRCRSAGRRFPRAALPPRSVRRWRRCDGRRVCRRFSFTPSQFCKTGNFRCGKDFYGWENSSRRWRRAAAINRRRRTRFGAALRMRKPTRPRLPAPSRCPGFGTWRR